MRNTKFYVVNGVKAAIVAPAFLAAAFSAPAMADDEYIDTARVLSVTPQAERVNMPREECRTEYQRQSYSSDDGHSIAGAVIGGIAGGLLGNTVGRGSGRIAAAAVGAGVGAIAGDRIANNRNNTVSSRSVPVQTCYQVDNWQTVTSGYLVSYEYNGRTYTTVTASDPGKYIDVNVAVSPSSRVVSQISYIEPAYYDKPGKHKGYGKYRDWDDRDYRRESRYY